MRLVNLIRSYQWPFYVAAVAFLVPAFILGNHLLEATGGVFSLPHDEAYFQLSTAKTLAFWHVWGIGPYDFAAASPSLLYPLVLAVAFCIFGAHLIVVPVLNSIIAIVLLSYMQQWLGKKKIALLSQFLILLAVIILSSLPVLAIYSIDSTLLLLLAFLFVSRLADEWQFHEFSRRTLIYGALMVAARYDGVLLIVGICLLLLWGRKWLKAAELAVWCLLPVLAFGIICLYKGSFFLPNIFIIHPVGSLLSHNWLVGCGVAMAPMLRNYFVRRPQPNIRLTKVLPIAAIVLSLITTNLYAVRKLDSSSIAIHRQQYPVARFAHRYYNGYAVVSDDIGMISFLTDGRYLDLSGLATPEIARSRIDHFFSPGLIRHLSLEQNSQVAIISSRYDKALPDSWIKAASWESAGVGSWLFYAPDTLAASNLRKNLDNFAPLLPSNINVRYFR